MALDPRIFPTRTVQQAASAIADLAKRVAALEKAPTVQVGSGAPTVAATSLRQGTPYIDRTNLRLYYVVGNATDNSANVWRYTALT